MMSMTFFGQFLVVAMPDEQAAQTVGPSTLQLFSLFAGFMITPAKIPAFWRFMYRAAAPNAPFSEDRGPIRAETAAAPFIRVVAAAEPAPRDRDGIRRYWISPVHYFLEGLTTSQFHENENVEFVVGATFNANVGQLVPVEYTAHRYMVGRGEFSKFEGWFVWNHHWYIVIYLISLSVVLRLLTTYFLAYVSYKTQ